MLFHGVELNFFFLESKREREREREIERRQEVSERWRNRRQKEDDVEPHGLNKLQVAMGLIPGE